MGSPTEREQIGLLDAFWDDGYASADLDPTLARAVQHLGALHDRIAPRPAFAAELWGRLPAGVQAESSGRAGGRSARRSSRVVGQLGVPRLVPRFGAGTPGAVTTASAVVLTLLLVVVAFRPGGSPSRSAWPVGPDVPIELWNVYYGDQDGGQDVLYTRLDPETLADAPPDTPVGDQAQGTWVLSADGTTLVTFQIDYTPGGETAETTVEVFAGLSGPWRARYVFPRYAHNARVSADGSRLAIEWLPDPSQIGDVGPIDPPEWQTIDTATGDVFPVIPADEEFGWPAGSWIDLGARRGYRLFQHHSSTELGPWPVVVVGYDLTTGVEFGRLEMPGVRGGSWVIGTSVDTWGNTYPKGAILQPGVAVSPDGRSLALVHADEDAVTIVDAERMAVVRTASFQPQASVGERLLAFLSLAPASAAAKGPSVGTVRQVAFAADGRHLYVWGYEQTEDDEGVVVAHGAGLRLIDVEGGAVVQEAMSNTVVRDLVPTADGRYVYVCEAAAGGMSYWIRRLDPLSLDVEAERFLVGAPRLLVRPAVTSGGGYRPDGEGFR